MQSYVALPEAGSVVALSGNANRYDVRYVGHEPYHGEKAHVFQIKPKRFEAGQRYFFGLMTVDADSMQIRKLAGKGVGAQSTPGQDYPVFETFHEVQAFVLPVKNENGEAIGTTAKLYLLPAKTVSDRLLWANEDRETRIHLTVRWTDYVREQVITDVTYGDVPAASAKPR